ncbi:pro-neuregulin-1, membrane-bound isoform [Pempheris klunzingeri]|uniref:pro-neuregulin-1, membrane-bound isoform n=1 Tax=Pempheris klunzingeri TaxID=3127111 RepID=UPI00397F6173
MTEGMEDFPAGPAPPLRSASPTSSTVDTGQIPKEKPEESEAAGQSGEEGAEETAEGGGGDDGEHLGIVALPGPCCVCIEMEQINNCLHSEKICILPILACLLSLALCTAGLKWVFVDKIFEYEPPTHLDPKRIGQDPIIISVDRTLGLTMSIPHLSPSTGSLSTTIAITPGRPEIIVEEKSTQAPYVPQSPRVTQSDPSVTLKYNAERSTLPKQTAHPQTTQELNDIIVPTISATSTTTTVKTSSHVTRCSDSQRNYCVNGGECFTLEIMPGSTKFLCRCLAGFTGHRCEQAVLKKVSDPKQAEELYQKRILTITGICIALLVVGIMCVVAYCKTKKQRKKLHDRLRQSLRNKRSNNTNTGIGPNLASSARGRQISNLPLQDLQLINRCNGATMQHAAEKDTETTFSTSKYALSVHGPNTFTHISSQRISIMTTPTLLSPVSQTSLATPGSPPSETSAPLFSLAISVPSVTLSPSGEEERPLLLLNKCQPHRSVKNRREEQKRTSAHYNHGHVAYSLPASPLFTMENGNYEIIGDHDTTLWASPEELLSTNNNDCSTKIAGLVDTSGHFTHDVKSSCDNMLLNEKEEPQGVYTPSLNTGITTVLLLTAGDGNRTNPALPNDDLQDKSCSSPTKQDRDV